VAALLVIDRALVISVAGTLSAILLVDILLVLSGLAGGSLDTELVEFDWFIELFPQPTRNITARRGMSVFMIISVGKYWWKTKGR
jgi:hypothetical protein